MRIRIAQLPFYRDTGCSCVEETSAAARDRPPADRLEPRLSQSPGPASACELCRGCIQQQPLGGCLTPLRIWQYLGMDFGFSHEYASVECNVRPLKKRHPEEVTGVMERWPGKEAWVDFFEESPTLHPQVGTGAGFGSSLTFGPTRTPR